MNCPRLPEKIPFYAAVKPLGAVEAEPLSPLLQPVEAIVEAAKSNSQSVYLDRVGPHACAYPVRLEDPIWPQTFAYELLAPKYFHEDALFGTPTSLKVESMDQGFDGAIFDPVADRFFAPSVRGMRWYLAGDSDNYLHFLNGIAGFTDQLESAWNRKTQSFSNLIPWDFGEMPPPSFPSPIKAYLEIGRFLTWLKDFDSLLYGEIGGQQLGYAEKMPWNDDPHYRCESSLDKNAYAFYDFQSSRISLMPMSIKLLENREYEKVAQILAHENGHRKSHQSGLAIPSEEMFTRSLWSFLDNMAQGDFYELIAARLLGGRIQGEAWCKLLPMLPEEEYQAFGAELQYAHLKGFDRQTAALSEEATEGAAYMTEQLASYFPPEWSLLGAQYVYLARR